jgi:hypothetical protein
MGYLETSKIGFAHIVVIGIITFDEYLTNIQLGNIMK